VLNPVILFYVKDAIIRRVNSCPTLIPESNRRRVASAWNRFFAARRKRGLTAKQIGVEWRAKKRGTRKGQRRKTARRAFTGRRSPNPPRRKMARRRMKTPHPSITGMAAGFSLLDDLNQGDVIGQVLAGNATGALANLSTNAQSLVKSPTGRTALIQAIAIAAIGTAARKALPGTKLGGKSLYLTI